MEKVYEVHGTGLYNISVKVWAESENEAYKKAEEEYFDGIVEVESPVGDCDFDGIKEIDQPKEV